MSNHYSAANLRFPSDDARLDFTRFAWLSNGKIPPQGLKPHDDITAEFPYLGPPNRYPAG